MAKKKTENPDGLTEEEQVVEVEMMEDSDDSEVVAEDEAQGDETLSTEETEKPAEEEAKAEEPVPPTTVPLAALDSERHKRKEAEGRLAVLEDRVTRMEAPPPEASVEMPDPVVDPEGFKGWLAQREFAASQPVVQMTAHMRQQQERSDLRQFAATSEATFASETTDYSKALDYARDLKAQEFRMWGFSEDQIPQLINFSEEQVTTLAKERGVNPAQIVYNYAKLHGYKAAAPAEDTGEKITRLAEVQKKTQSTAGAGGSAREEEWTAERLAGLSDKEMSEVPADVFQRVMGG